VDVDSGAWPLYRWNPSLQEEGGGSDPFSLDSAKLKSDVHEFLKRDQHLSLMARRSPVVNPSLTRSAESELHKKGHSAQARAAEKRLASSFAALRSGLSQQNGASSSTTNLNLLVLYGSDGGNGASVAETLARKAELSGCGETRCQEANDFKVEDLENETNVLFVLATAGQGEDCANAKRLTADIMASKTKLPKLKYAVFGLGDSSYWGEGTADSAKYFCLPARRLHDKLKELSASPMVHVGLGDDQNDDGYDGALSEWEPAVWKALKVKVVSGNLGGAPPVVDDEIKIQSNYLRGTIAEGLADLSTGKLVFEDTKLTKFHGIYQQDDRDIREKLDAKGLERAYTFMIRIGVPGGVATAQQYLQMEDLCDRYATGRLKLTTRQAYQFHGIIKKNLKTTMQGINRACMDTLAACGDVHRNIIANPRRHDGEVYEAVTELARAINAHLKPKTSAYHEIWLDKKPVAGYKDVEPLYGITYLPRKFKVAIAVPPENDVDVFAHCAGFIAIVQNGNLTGYNVCAGGGLGTTHGDKNTYPRLSDVIGFCLPEQAVKVVEGIMVVQRDHGERLNRKHARLKYTVEDHGYQWYRQRVEEHCGFKLQEARPFKFETNADNYGWRKGARTGLWTYTMFVENGYIHDENPQYKLKSALHELAHMLVAFNGEITLTANQNAILGGIPDGQKANIVRVLAKWGVDNAQYSAMRLHSMACVALPTCALAMAESQRYLPSLITKLEHTLDEVGLRHDAITIRMTGCPNGCARPYLAEIAFIGKAPGVYNLHLGGGFAGNRLNRIYKEGVNEEQILAILRPLLTRYASERRTGERFGDFLIRVKVIMPVYHGHSFWAKDEAENDTTSRSGTVQLYW
jgi:sulfite reductase (NADPH) hemoprotein beta-component